MEVVAVESVTIDGVMQAPGAAGRGRAPAAIADTANAAERRFLQRQRDALGVR